MPLKLIPPRAGKTPYWYVRGTHLGIAMDRSTKAIERETARAVLRKWKDEIERGCFAVAGEPTFVDAATDYIAATGKERFVRRLTEHFGFTPLREITQKAIDDAAITLYPHAQPATRNRHVHTVVSAILKHSGEATTLRRPKGSRGHKRVNWLKPAEAFALFDAADRRDAEFGLFLRTLVYTGMRLSEATGMRIARIDLANAFGYVPTTKNSDPRGVHFPPTIVAALANHPRGMDRPAETVFRFRKCGRLYTWLDEAFAGAGIKVPPRTGFHLLRHTWATWMRQYGGLDVRGLVGTGAWSDEQSAARYAHVVATDEARRADLLPIETKAANK